MKKPKTELQISAADASDFKQQYMELMGSCAFTISNIDAKPEWAWARTEECRGRLATLREKLDAASQRLSPIGIGFLAGVSIESLAELHPERNLTDALAAVKTTLDADYAALRGHMDKVLSMHSIMTTKS